jgi:hypothetical protein
MWEKEHILVRVLVLPNLKLANGVRLRAVVICDIPDFTTAG